MGGDSCALHIIREAGGLIRVTGLEMEWRPVGLAVRFQDWLLRPPQMPLPALTNWAPGYRLLSRVHLRAGNQSA